MSRVVMSLEEKSMEILLQELLFHWLVPWSLVEKSSNLLTQ